MSARTSRLLGMGWAGILVSAMVGILVWAPGLAEACSVCSAGRDEENQLAFLLSTIFMSLMPLITIGGVVYVLWRRFQRFDAEQQHAPIPEVGTTPDSAPQQL
jgi:membrane protein DedA with SNARE-associated domain